MTSEEREPAMPDHYDGDPLRYIQPYEGGPDPDCTCNLCWAEYWLARDGERVLSLRNSRRFVMLVSRHRPYAEFIALYEERQRRIASGEHPGDLVCICGRCGRPFTPWHERPQPWCPPCRDQRWTFDEDWVRSKAYKNRALPMSEHAPGLRLGE